MKNLYDSTREAEMIENLKSLEVSAPDGLWDDIDATLKAKNKRRIIIFSSWASAATVALLFTIGGIYSIQSSVEALAKSNQVNNSNIISVKKESSISQLKSNKTIPSRGLLNIKSQNKQIVIANLSKDSTELAPQESREKLSIPKQLVAIQSTIKTSSASTPDRIKIPNQFNKLNPDRAIALDDLIKSKSKGDWYIAASGFPVYSFHSAGAMNKSGTQQETGINSWGGSFSVRKAFANRISIETGLAYSPMGQKEKNLYLAYSDSKNPEVFNNKEFTNSFGTLEVSNPNYKVMDIGAANVLSFVAVNESSFKKVDALQRFRYLEIPLLISKGFYLKGISFYLKAGVSASFLIQNILEFKGSNIHQQGKTTGVDLFTPSALSSMGVSIPITKSANLLIEPSFKLGLKSLPDNNGKSYPFSSYIKFGIELSI